MKKKWIAAILSAIFSVSLVACTNTGSSGAASQPESTDGDEAEAVTEETSDTTEQAETQEQQAETSVNLAKLDMNAWQYNADDDVYYQIGLRYCETPADENYESLAVFVPGAYFTGIENADGSYTCEINTDAKVGKFTVKDAPIVMPVDTPGYAAQAPLTEYSSFTEYTKQGFVYVHAGCRGRDAGAPAGVTDMKAAIRFLRYNAGQTPGDTERIFVFGMSGGGAQSALIGATGDSSLYEPYLEQIGAAMDVSDAVLGSMDWCPITNLESADAAYEWMMGNTRSGLSEEEQAISDALASAYADYINAEGIKDPEGKILTLEASKEGIMQSARHRLKIGHTLRLEGRS
ncbi:MAG: hypothetical protein IJ827_01575 [Lachnospiraceae bacterium]|nr:hypothetical protein [Lachnospiraceae bacterium]